MLHHHVDIFGSLLACHSLLSVLFNVSYVWRLLHLIRGYQTYMDNTLHYPWTYAHSQCGITPLMETKFHQ